MQVKEYDKKYQIGYNYLKSQATSEHFEIFEESENQGHGYKHGLTLVEYKDREHTVETNVVSIDLANF